MTYNIENFTVRTLIQPSIHLYLLLTSKALKETDKKIILDSLINEDIQTIIDTIEINIIANLETNTPEGLLLGMQCRLFINEIRQSYAYIRDLHYHKTDGNVSNHIQTIRDILEKHNVPLEIAEEVYTKLFVKNVNDKNKENNKLVTFETARKQRDADILKRYKK